MVAPRRAAGSSAAEPPPPAGYAASLAEGIGPASSPDVERTGGSTPLAEPCMAMKDL